MGSIIGSLYAAGYSSDSILFIARRMNWDQVLSNQSSLRNIIMEEKTEYGKYYLVGAVIISAIILISSLIIRKRRKKNLINYS